MDNKNRKFVFVKDFSTGNPDEVITTGSELYEVNGTIYFNGGMVIPSLQLFFEDLIKKEEDNPKYLKEVEVIYNKI